MQVSKTSANKRLASLNLKCDDLAIQPIVNLGNRASVSLPLTTQQNKSEVSESPAVATRRCSPRRRPVQDSQLMISPGKLIKNTSDKFKKTGMSKSLQNLSENDKSVEKALRSKGNVANQADSIKLGDGIRQHTDVDNPADVEKPSDVVKHADTAEPSVDVVERTVDEPAKINEKHAKDSIQKKQVSIGIQWEPMESVPCKAVQHSTTDVGIQVDPSELGVIPEKDTIPSKTVSDFGVQVSNVETVDCLKPNDGYPEVCWRCRSVMFGSSQLPSGLPSYLADPLLSFSIPNNNTESLTGINMSTSFFESTAVKDLLYFSSPVMQSKSRTLIDDLHQASQASVPTTVSTDVVTSPTANVGESMVTSSVPTLSISVSTSSARPMTVIEHDGLMHSASSSVFPPTPSPSVSNHAENGLEGSLGGNLSADMALSPADSVSSGGAVTSDKESRPFDNPVHDTSHSCSKDIADHKKNASNLLSSSPSPEVACDENITEHNNSKQNKQLNMIVSLSLPCSEVRSDSSPSNSYELFSPRKGDALHADEPLNVSRNSSKKSTCGSFSEKSDCRKRRKSELVICIDKRATDVLVSKLPLISCEKVLPVEAEHMDAIPDKEPDKIDKIPDKEPDKIEKNPDKEPDKSEKIPDKEPDKSEQIPDKEPDKIEKIPDKEPHESEKIPDKEPDKMEKIPDKEPDKIEKFSDKADYIEGINQNSFTALETAAADGEFA